MGIMTESRLVMHSRLRILLQILIASSLMLSLVFPSSFELRQAVRWPRHHRLPHFEFVSSCWSAQSSERFQRQGLHIEHELADGFFANLSIGSRSPSPFILRFVPSADVANDSLYLHLYVIPVCQGRSTANSDLSATYLLKIVLPYQKSQELAKLDGSDGRILCRKR
jgi:hypothetical protein